MDFLEFCTQPIGLQLLQLELRLGKTPSRSFRPLKSAEIFWQIWTSCSLRVPYALDKSWRKWEPSLWLFWLTLSWPLGSCDGSRDQE
ncbi:hypothetical protein Tco_0973256 [Tanacetum coccineum]